MVNDYKQKFKNNSKKESYNKHGKNKDKILFSIGTSKHSSHYKSTSQCLVNSVEKECARCNDVSEALRNLAWPDVTKSEPTSTM